MVLALFGVLIGFYASSDVSCLDQINLFFVQLDVFSDYYSVKNYLDLEATARREYELENNFNCIDPKHFDDDHNLKSSYIEDELACKFGRKLQESANGFITTACCNTCARETTGRHQGRHARHGQCSEGYYCNIQEHCFSCDTCCRYNDTIDRSPCSEVCFPTILPDCGVGAEESQQFRPSSLSPPSLHSSPSPTSMVDAFADNGKCSDACDGGAHFSDGICRDGGTGATSNDCELGTDCTDCGSRGA